MLLLLGLVMHGPFQSCFQFPRTRPWHYPGSSRSSETSARSHVHSKNLLLKTILPPTNMISNFYRFVNPSCSFQHRRARTIATGMLSICAEGVKYKRKRPAIVFANRNSQNEVDSNYSLVLSGGGCFIEDHKFPDCHNFSFLYKKV